MNGNGDLPPDPLTHYLRTNLSVRAVARLYHGQPKCSLAWLQTRYRAEGWKEQRRQFIARISEVLLDAEIERLTRHANDAREVQTVSKRYLDALAARTADENLLEDPVRAEAETRILRRAQLALAGAARVERDSTPKERETFDAIFQAAQDAIAELGEVEFDDEDESTRSA
jgi:hypothetical protein